MDRGPVILPLYGAVLDSAWPWAVAQMSRYPIPYTADQVREKCDERHLTAWAVIDGEPLAFVLLCKEADGVAHIAYAAGDEVDRWETLVIQTVYDWAIDNGCHTVCVEGRKGWGRRLKKYGFSREGERWVSKPSRRP